MLLRTEIHPNEYPERSGHYIYAQRLGGVYRLRIIKYTDTQTTIRIHSLSKDKFNFLIAYYGVQIAHSLLFSEYLIRRDKFVVWCGRQNRRTTTIAVCPNHREILLDSPPKGKFRWTRVDSSIVYTEMIGTDFYAQAQSNSP